MLFRSTPFSEDIPDLYLEFARRLQPIDFVLTFNYDVLLERALDAVDKPYRLFPNRYPSGHGDDSLTADLLRKEVVILKLHGSIDWFDRRQFSKLEKEFREQGFSGSPCHHSVFSNMKNLGVTKLLEGPGASDDLLNEMHRVADVKALYRQSLMFNATPWLLAPSTMKILYAKKLRDFWYGLGEGGTLNLGMAIIGYSLPPQDDYARQAVYTLVRNYHWEEEILGKRKSPLVIVGYCEDDEQLQGFKGRYRFVDWKRAVLHTDGLNERAVELIFDGE